MSIKAQLVCNAFDPIDRDEVTAISDKDKMLHFGTKSGTFEQQILKNCTLVYRKDLDIAVFKTNHVSTSVTPEGLLVPASIGSKTVYSSNILSSEIIIKHLKTKEQVDNNVIIYQFDESKALHVPILKHTHKKKITYCIDYRNDQTIRNLNYLQYFDYKDNNGKLIDLLKDFGEVPTLFLYSFPESNFLNQCITGIRRPMKNPTTIAPLITTTPPLRISETVTSTRAANAKELKAALKRPINSSFVGIAMQHINVSKQGDIMLHNNI